MPILLYLFRLYLAAKKLISNLALFFIVGMSATAIMIEIPPLFEETNRLPFLFWYPSYLRSKLEENNFIFGALYFHQFFVGAFCSLIENGVDTFLFASLIFLKYQLTLLGNRLSECGTVCSSEPTSRRISHREQLLDCLNTHIDIEE